MYDQISELVSPLHIQYQSNQTIYIQAHSLGACKKHAITFTPMIINTYNAFCIISNDVGSVKDSLQLYW